MKINDFESAEFLVQLGPGYEVRERVYRVYLIDVTMGEELIEVNYFHCLLAEGRIDVWLDERGENIISYGIDDDIPLSVWKDMGRF